MHFRLFSDRFSDSISDIITAFLKCNLKNSLKNGLKYSLKNDLKNAIEGAEELCSDCPVLDDQAKEIIVEMVFQLGKTGVSKFRNMWKALKVPDYPTAAKEMLDSRWAKQTPGRAKEMSDHMRDLA